MGAGISGSVSAMLMPEGFAVIIDVGYKSF
jgi:hypothetical protein